MLVSEVCAAGIFDNLGESSLSLSAWCAGPGTTVAMDAPVVAASTTFWVAASAIATTLAVFVALFKDEFWNALHAPKLEVTIDRRWWEVTLVLRNASTRMAAHRVEVRLTELESHPLLYTTGPKWTHFHLAEVDKRLPRGDGDEVFDIPPGGEVRLGFASLSDCWTEGDAATVNLGSGSGMTLLALPSKVARDYWEAVHPELNDLNRDAAAMVRFEVSANNVAAKKYTLRLKRDRDRPAGDALPLAPGIRSQVWDVVLVVGSSPRNDARHGSSLRQANNPPALPSSGPPEIWPDPGTGEASTDA